MSSAQSSHLIIEGQEYMAQTYLQLQRQIEKLQHQAERLKAQEVSGVVERIKVAIEHYGLTAEQLGFGSSKGTSRTAMKSSSKTPHNDLKAAKYADGQGNVWSGRGPRPHWLRDALAAGKPMESFASGSQPATSRKRKSKASQKRTAQQYRDDGGNTWSGFGPRPRWLKDALAAGASLEQFAVSRT
jgi:DNA-binding protein H-NS